MKSCVNHLVISLVFFVFSSFSFAKSDIHRHAHEQEEQEKNDEQDEQFEHIHGRGQAKIKFSKKKLTIKLSLPTHSIIGFEREAKTDEQRKMLAEAEKKLTQQDEVISLSPEANCMISNKRLKIKRFKESKYYKHADFNVKYKYKCQKPLNLTKIRILFFSAFSNLHNVDVRIRVGDNATKTIEITREQDTLDIASLRK